VDSHTFAVERVFVFRIASVAVDRLCGLVVSSWLQIQVLVSTIEELLERKSIGFGLENREYGRGDPSR
jgi:hypothetical protein